MPHNLTPIAVTNPATAINSVTVPDAGDARTAASVVTPIQKLTDMVAYLFNVLVGNVPLDLVINGSVVCNGLTSIGTTNIQATQDLGASRDVNATRDCNVGRNALVQGFVRSTHRIAAGAVTTGAHFFGPDAYAHVYNLGTVASGCVWKIDGSVATYGIEKMTFSNLAQTQIFLQDPSGTQIAGLIRTTGNVYSVDVAKIGGSWVVIDERLQP